MKKQPPRYEPPVLAPLLEVGRGQQSPACIDGSAPATVCSPNGAFATGGCQLGSAG